MNAHGLRIGCIADDFTGGSDAASFLRKAGLQTVLVDGAEGLGILKTLQAEAVVVALKSRSIPAAEAVSQTLAAARELLALGAGQLYFKYCSTFDSTPQGNIGPVTDALMELTESRYTLLCPSLPVNGRTVRDGILYVDGVPLGESPMRDHPVNPMTGSEIPALMKPQSRCPCLVLGGPETWDGALAAALAEYPRFTLVPSYETDGDGERIARTFGGLPLLTGGSGLLEHLGRRLGGSRAEGPPRPASPGLPRLLLAGSCSAMTRRQVDAYLAGGKAAVRMEPDKLLQGLQTEEALRRAIQTADGDLLLYSTAAPDQVRHSQRRGAKAVSDLLEPLMGRLAVYGREAGFRRIVVAGGETSGAVIRALGACAFRIGEDAAPGVPELWPVDRPELCLALKSGNFGDEDFFLRALADGPI
ncbi:3-oxo-tetronate kinase [Oscillibacter sp.]|uniref:3-oxo-tetronate kinase n=1 Tax=Oscillibacter sp. TaxID=1945593 RepID=UPI002D7EB58C|nr:3-oxo-tetronate kinase [Oscillibacter sp.]